MAFFKTKPPRMHNCAVVKRIRAKVLRKVSDKTNDIPFFATVEALGNFKRSGIVRSRVSDYGDMDWTRNIFWMRGRFFVVVDDFVARENGVFDVAVYWQTSGRPSLDGNHYSVSQPIKNLPHPDKKTLDIRKFITFHIKNAGSVKSSTYQENAAVLKHAKRAKLKIGERIRVANLLYITSDNDNSHTVMEIENGANGAIIVRQQSLTPDGKRLKSTRTVTLGVTDKPLEIGGLSLDAGAFIKEGAYTAVAGVKRMSRKGIKSNKPQSIELLDSQ
jgi:hypothetical protein